MDINCCICLKFTKELNPIYENEAKTKLSLLIPEVEWDNNWYLCYNCLNNLNLLYTFRDLCLKNTQRNKKCETCGKTFKTNRALKTHTTKIHKQTKEEQNGKAYEENNDKSIKQETNETGNESKEDHRQNCNAKKPYFQCDICESQFATSRKLTIHLHKFHNIDLKTIKPFKCDKCAKKFSTSSHLLQHKLYHEGDRIHMCTYCGKGFITLNDVNIHEKQHLNKREYKCEICLKSFNTHKNIRTHKIVVHADPSTWNHVCGYCDKRFPMKSNLDQHVRRHTGDKRFACHLCDKRFIDKVVMQRHIGSHSNVRPHKCGQCKKEYKDKKILEIHLAKVHGIGDAKIPTRVREKKFFCHVCPKSYFDKTKLTKHLYFHTGERPFTCHICLKGFADRSYVGKHLRAVHNVET